jgi:hypothetical protein
VHTFSGTASSNVCTLFLLLRSVSDSNEKTLTKIVRITVNRNSIQFSNIISMSSIKKTAQGGQRKTSRGLTSPQILMIFLY